MTRKDEGKENAMTPNDADSTRNTEVAPAQAETRRAAQEALADILYDLGDLDTSDSFVMAGQLMQRGVTPVEHSATVWSSALHEARARYSRLLLDLLADDDITISRAAELTGISVLGIRQWSREALKSGNAQPFPFPVRNAQAEAGDQS